MRSQATRWPAVVHDGDRHPEAQLLRALARPARCRPRACSSDERAHRSSTKICSPSIAHRVGRHRAAAGREQALAGAHVEHPAVPRARQPGARHHALRAAGRSDASTPHSARGPRRRSRTSTSGLPSTSTGYGCPGVTSSSAATRISLTGLPSHVLLQDVGAMQAASCTASASRSPGAPAPAPRRCRAGRRAVALDDLVAALAVDLVGLDVDGEELHLVVVEAVVRLERREVAAGRCRAPGTRAPPAGRRRRRGTAGATSRSTRRSAPRVVGQLPRRLDVVPASPRTPRRSGSGDRRASCPPPPRRCSRAGSRARRRRGNRRTPSRTSAGTARRTGSAGTTHAPSWARVSSPLTHFSVNGFIRLCRALTAACSCVAERTHVLRHGRLLVPR